jgi:hypothetical protein
LASRLECLEDHQVECAVGHIAVDLGRHDSPPLTYRLPTDSGPSCCLSTEVWWAARRGLVGR